MLKYVNKTCSDFFIDKRIKNSVSCIWKLYENRALYRNKIQFASWNYSPVSTSKSGDFDRWNPIYRFSLNVGQDSPKIHSSRTKSRAFENSNEAGIKDKNQVWVGEVGVRIPSVFVCVFNFFNRNEWKSWSGTTMRKIETRWGDKPKFHPVSISAAKCYQYFICRSRELGSLSNYSDFFTYDFDSGFSLERFCLHFNRSIHIYTK